MVVDKGWQVPRAMGKEGGRIPSKTEEQDFGLSSPMSTCWFYLTNGAADEKINLEIPSATESQVLMFFTL